MLSSPGDPNMNWLSPVPVDDFLSTDVMQRGSIHFTGMLVHQTRGHGGCSLHAGLFTDNLIQRLQILAIGD